MVKDEKLKNGGKLKNHKTKKNRKSHPPHKVVETISEINYNQETEENEIKKMYWKTIDWKRLRTFW